jgi:hypothetical protein
MLASPNLKNINKLKKLSAFSFISIFFIITIHQWDRYNGNAAFYERELAPAVVFACTNEIKNIYGPRSSSLENFLSRRNNQLKCSDLFPLGDGVILGPLNIHQEQSIGFIVGFGLLWKFFGFTWSVAAIFAGLFVVGFLCGIYLISRNFVSWFASAVLAVGGTSAVLLLDPFLPLQLRDFSKAPFIFLLVGSSAALCSASGVSDANRAAFLSAILLAIGISFRPDVSVFYFIIFIAFLVFSIQRYLDIKLRILYPAVVFTITVAFLDVLIDFSSGIGKNNFHFANLGLTQAFQGRLKVDQAFYLLGVPYNDSYIWQTTNLFASSNGLAEAGYASREYDVIGGKLFLKVLTDFPGDMLLRALLAMCSSLYSFGGMIDNAFYLVIFSWAVLTVLFFSLNVKSFFVLTTINFLAALTSIQFDRRHYFLYEYIGVALTLISVLFLIGRVIPRGANAFFFAMEGGFSGGSSLIVNPLARYFPSVIAAVLGIIIFIARPYQDARASEIIHALGKAHVVRSPGVSASISGRGVEFELPSGERSFYGRLSISPGKASADAPRSLTVKYQSSEPFFDWTHEIKFPSSEVREVYIPLLQNEKNSLRSINLNCDGCLTNFALITPPGGVVPQIYMVGKSALVEEGLGDDTQTTISRYERALETALRRLVISKTHCWRSPEVLGSSQPFFSKVGSDELPSEVAFFVSESDGNMSSDHVAVLSPTFYIASMALPVSGFKVVRKQVPMFDLLFDKNILQSGDISVRGKSYFQSFSVHAPAEVVFEVPATVVGLRGDFRWGVGVDDTALGAGSAAVRVCYVYY